MFMQALSRFMQKRMNNIFERRNTWVSVCVCVWSSIFLIRHRVAGINLTNTSMQSWGIYTQSNTHKRTDMPVSHCNSTCSHVQTSINKLTLTHPHIEQIHTVVSMNMRRVTSVLIVYNDCSHGPSPCCCDAVPLSIIVAAPSITLHSHSHCWTLHTQYRLRKHIYIKGVVKTSSWLTLVSLLWPSCRSHNYVPYSNC